MISLLPPTHLRQAKLSDFEKPFSDFLEELVYEAEKKCSSQTLLYGPEGSGKSYAAAALINYLAEKKWQCSWIDSMDWPGDFNASRQMLDDAKRPRILVVDDLGREPKNIRGDIEALINYRHNHNKWTVYTSNLTVDEDEAEDCALTTHYNRAIRSRLLARDVVLLDGADRREDA